MFRILPYTEAVFPREGEGDSGLGLEKGILESLGPIFEKEKVIIIRISIINAYMHILNLFILSYAS
jgi:hypothetical protein